ncbi:acyl-CoA desaturase [Parasulfitobacter algicola]|nr:acyl-CoA desaturase [Sulfitobacter algicola]
MPKLIDTDRVFAKPNTDNLTGHVRWSPAKSIWTILHTIAGLTGIFLFPQWDALAVFIILTAITICAGHSVGMHRLLIHRSFKTPLWMEHLLVWLGTLVGMAGPFGMIRAHDMRDWHQRQIKCPPHPSHDAGFWKDAYWQIHCEYLLTHPPRFEIEPKVAKDRFYRFVEATWMAQQLPLAIILWLIGGWAFVLWGISLRIALSLTGHWMIGHFAHRRGQQGWYIKNLPVQGYNLPGLGLVTFGENWHGNHHAFPHSAKLGVEKGQFDPGYILIRAMGLVGLASDIKYPGSEPMRDGLQRTETF